MLIGTLSQASVWLIRALCLVPIALAALWLLGLRYNVTPSVPLGFYRAHSFDPQSIVRGEYVCLRASADSAPEALRATSWGQRREILLKRVEGLPGDRVSESHDSLALNGTPIVHSHRLARDSRGLELPHPRLPIRLGEHELWLGSASDSGYDSRYFGPVNVTALDCVAEPLWTF